MSFGLGIETSCDETAASVIKDGKTVLSNIVSSQWRHSKFGGVVPELASRAHIPLIVPITRTALEVSGITYNNLSYIAATYGPGLIGSILVGLSYAKALSFGLKIPFVGVDHLEGHIFSIFLEHPNIELPFLTLIISGGHTELILVKDFCDYQTLGTTLDDACGEAFDKVAKMLTLPYPGGRFIEELAKKGSRTIKFPIPRIPKYDFSFSGLKTAVLYYLRDKKNPKREDIACSFQEVVFDFLESKIISAVDDLNIRRLGIAGGVAANGRLRERLNKLSRKYGIMVFIPAQQLCTDNAAMICAAGYERLKKFGPSPLNLAATARKNL